MKVSRATTIRNKRKMLQTLLTKEFVVKPSCKTVGIHITTHYRWLRNDKGYKMELDRIIALHKKLEDERFARWQEKFYQFYWSGFSS